MNWVWPMAPAHEPFIASKLISPRWRILSADTSWGLANLDLVPEQIRVAERTDHVLVAGLHAVIRFHAPDRHDDGAVDPVAVLERAEQRLILDQLLLADLDALLGDRPVDIFADRLHIFGLEIGGLDHFRVGREALEGAIEGRARDAGALGRQATAPRRICCWRAPAPDSAKTSRAADPAPRIKDLGSFAIRMARFLASMPGKT